MVITSLNQGGTGADLSGTGGANEFVKQTAAGANFSVEALTTADLAGVGVVLNPTAAQSIVGQSLRLTKTAPLYPDAGPNHYVFPWCENRQIDLSRPTRGCRTAWRHALKLAGFHCKFHDLRHTCITKLAEGQANDMTIMAIAGHVSKKMLERYSDIRMQAKRTALDGLVPIPERRVFEGGVHQMQVGNVEVSAKSLN
jgi:hypothetical protein